MRSSKGASPQTRNAARMELFMSNFSTRFIFISYLLLVKAMLAQEGLRSTTAGSYALGKK